jgi:hypothetical protein
VGYNCLSNRSEMMITHYEDPVVKRKHLAQQEILKKAGGNINNYSRTIRDEVMKLREKYPGKFPKVLDNTKVP